MKEPVEAPQADRLDLVRRVVEAIESGRRTTDAIAEHARVAPRYAQYAGQAARLLGLVAFDASDVPSVSEVGTRVLATPRGSNAERSVLRAALMAAPAFSATHTMLLAEEVPTTTDLAEILLRSSPMALSTALRRARTMLAWRRYLVDDDGPQLRLVDADTSIDEDASLPPEPPPGAPTLPEGSAAAELAVEAGPEPEGASNQPAAPEAQRRLPDSVLPPPIVASLEAPVAATGARADSPATADDSSTPTLLHVEHNDLAYLRRHTELGNLVLMTGAGFSLGARNVDGKQLPDGAKFAKELWDLCYPGEASDGSTLADIFEHAARVHRRALDVALRTRFAVDAATLPSWYGEWLSFPWFKAYTLNVDDLPSAVERAAHLPRPLRVVSAVTGASTTKAPSTLEIVQLNGRAIDGAECVTFATQQYAERLAHGDQFYLQLRAEMLTRPFIFVGSPLDESLLWQHLAMRGPRDSENEQRPKSFLVSPSISRARADKLRTHNIMWIKATAEEFARDVLAQLQVEAMAGIARLGHAEAAASGDERNIVEVSSALLDRERPSAFLLGAEPTWSDIRMGRAVERDEDRARVAQIQSFLRSPRAKGERIPTIVVRATAGAGKTTLLMKIGSQLHSDGVRVAWIGANAEVSPAVITRYCRGTGHPPVLIIDDAGRYGGQLGPLLRDVSKSDDLRLVVICLRSHQQQLIDVPDVDALELHEYGIGRLTDGDINRLLGVLEKERKLGALRALTAAERYSAFRDRADRQILVAMIEATSGTRFEEKIVAEWADQDDTARYIYAVVAVATMMGYAMSSAEVLLACNRAGGRELDALARLQRAELLREDVDKRLRLRHRVIAEKLVDELTGRGTQVEHVVVGLCRALAIGAGTEERGARRRRRVLARVLSHDFMLRLMDDIEPARSTYAQLEDYLEKDHHFWLQRGWNSKQGSFRSHATTLSMPPPLARRIRSLTPRSLTCSSAPRSRIHRHQVRRALLKQRSLR